jgi:selT/selW/selH-like putative selenoprotein
MLTKAFVMLSIFLLIFITALAGSSNDDESLLKKENITVEIHHCDTCGFRSRAAALAEELKKEFGIESKLVEGEIGSFNVFVNDELIFSKYEEGRFPGDGEIVQKINEYMKK